MSTIFLDRAARMHEILRQSAKNQLDSYADEWIVVFEALQNALDAVEGVEGARVRIEFDIGANRVRVYDNGPGFNPEKDQFGLGSGTKFNLQNPKIRGEHGVGMKMIILCSKRFELVTRTDGRLWYARFDDGFKFLESQEREFFDEDYSEVERLPEEFTTLVQYSFPSSDDDPDRPISVRNFIKGLFLDYQLVAPFDVFLKNKSKAALYVENYFRTNSYSADVNRLFDDSSKTSIEISIEKDGGLSEGQIAKEYPEYLVDWWATDSSKNLVEFPAKYWDVTEFFPDPVKRGFLTEEMLKSFTGRRLGDSKIWAIKLTDTEQFQELLRNPNVRDNYDTKSVQLLLKRIRGIYIVIASAAKSGRYNINRMILGKPDQIIAADGVVTTNQIRTPKRGKNQNYLNNIHFVINVDERVNYGKQGVKNPKLLSQVYKYFEEIYVKSLVGLAVSVAGKQPKVTELGEPEIVVTELGDLGGDLSVRKVPRHENTLIAILYELVGTKRVEGLETYHLSSFDQYDGKFNCRKPNSDEYRKIERDDDLLSIEFKLTLKDLIDDFETGTKNIEEVELVVVWSRELPKGSAKYNIVDLEHSGLEDMRISGVTEALCDMEGNSVAILDLAKLTNSTQ